MLQNSIVALVHLPFTELSTKDYTRDKSLNTGNRLEHKRIPIRNPWARFERQSITKNSHVLRNP